MRPETRRLSAPRDDTMDNKQKTTFEFILRCSPKFLYPYLNTPSGLSEWLCDNVTVRDGNHYTFNWDDEVRSATMSEAKSSMTIRFKWEDAEDEYMELSVAANEMTNDLCLSITDYIEPSEVDEYQMLWDNSVSSLRGVIGA